MVQINKTYVIGDIHGGLKGLKQAMERSPIKEGDRIIFLGDYVDGWSESAEVVQHLIELQDKYDCIFLRGNHDEWCNEWMKTGVRHPIWVNQGGKSTLESYIRTGYITSDEHKKFFRNLHNYYIDDQNRGFVHGGFVSRKGLGHDPYQSDYYWDRDMWQLAVLIHGRESEAQGNPKVLRFKKHKEVFIGHTSTINWTCKPHYPEYNNPAQVQNGPITIPMNRCNVWNLDTGGGFKGRITIMDIDSKEFWQSDLLTDLYPNEHGR